MSVLSTLRHPSIVLWLGACTVSPNTAIILEYMDRGSLHDVLHRSEAVLQLTHAHSMVHKHRQGDGISTHPQASRDHPLRLGTVTTSSSIATARSKSPILVYPKSSNTANTRQTGVTGTRYAPGSHRRKPIQNLPTSFPTALQFEIIARKIPWDGLTEYQIVYRMSSALTTLHRSPRVNNIENDRNDDEGDAVQSTS